MRSASNKLAFKCCVVHEAFSQTCESLTKTIAFAHTFTWQSKSCACVWCICPGIAQKCHAKTLCLRILQRYLLRTTLRLGLGRGGVIRCWSCVFASMCAFAFACAHKELHWKKKHKKQPKTIPPQPFD